MTLRISRIFAVVGATLAFGVSTAAAASGPAPLPARATIGEESTVVLPTHPQSHPMTEAPLDLNRRAQLGTVQTRPSPPVPVETNARERGPGAYPDRYKRTVVVGQADPFRSSAGETEWPQIGIGVGIGVALVLGVFLVARGTRQRLAH